MPRGSALHLGRLMDTSPQPSRIWLRLLAFNLLLLFLPIAGILYLDVYESRLLEAQERAMVQQARLVAAALGQGGTVDRGAAQQLFERLGQRDDGRLRVYDGTGTAIADSARVRYDKEREGAATAYAQASSSAARDTLLYRAGALAARGRAVLGRWGRRLLLVDRRPRPESPATVDAIPPEVKAALEGRYRAATRPTPGQRSLTLTSAVPIRAGDSIVGAVAVSQSTFRVLSTLYDVRLRIFQIVIASIGAGALLTAVGSSRVDLQACKLEYSIVSPK